LRQPNQRRTVCGRWVSHGEITTNPDAVTCDACIAEVKRFDDQKFGDDKVDNPF
jgi:hypothetical protein